MWPFQGSRVRPLALLMLLLMAGCSKSGDLSEIKQTGIFTQIGKNFVEIPKLGTLGTTYGPRLYPDNDYDIPVVTDVGPIYVNIRDFPVSTVKGIEWHGYRLGGIGSVDSRSTATPLDWKNVAVVTKPTKIPGLFKIVVGAADAKTGRWKPELSHEYFGVTLDTGYKPSPIWAVRIK